MKIFINGKTGNIQIKVCSLNNVNYLIMIKLDVNRGNWVRGIWNSLYYFSCKSKLSLK